jgi:hypothetical protein
MCKSLLCSFLLLPVSVGGHSLTLSLNQRLWMLEHSLLMNSDFFYTTKGSVCSLLSPIFLGWHKTRELQFSYIMLSIYTIITGFIVLNCCIKTQLLLSHYLYIFLSPTIHYNACGSVSAIRGNQYLLGIHWMCDIGIGVAKGTYFEWSITR